MHSKDSSHCHWLTRGHKPGTVSATQTGKEGTLNRKVMLLLANQAIKRPQPGSLFSVIQAVL